MNESKVRSTGAVCVCVWKCIFERKIFPTQIKSNKARVFGGGGRKKKRIELKREYVWGFFTLKYKGHRAWILGYMEYTKYI